MRTDDPDLVVALRAAAAAVPGAGRSDVADAVRGGERRRRRRRTGRAAAVSGLAAGLSVSAVALGVAALPVGPAALDLSPSGGDGAGPTAGQLLALLDRPATVQDRLPGGRDQGGEGMLSAASARLVASDGTTTFYAGTSSAGEVCVLLVLVQRETSGSSCAPPASFARQGVWIALEDAEVGTAVALLLPDAASPDDVERMAGAVGGTAGISLTAQDELAPNLLARTLSVDEGGGTAGAEVDE